MEKDGRMDREGLPNREATIRPRPYELINYLIGLPIASYLLVGTLLYALFSLVSAFALPADMLIASQEDMRP